LLLPVGKFEDHIGFLKSLQHLIVVQAGSLHCTHFIEGDESIVVQIGIAGQCNGFACCGLLLGKLIRPFGRGQVAGFDVGLGSRDQPAAA
jgi:hypothetical protein